MQSLIKELREGKPATVPAAYGYVVVFDPKNKDAVETMDAAYPGWESVCFIPASDLSALNLHLTLVPDIAWDLMEYATEPLIVLFEGLKNISDRLDGKEKLIGIMLQRSHPLTELTSRYGKPLIAVQPSLDWAKPALLPPSGKIKVPENMGKHDFAKYTVIRLWANGQIEFLQR